VRRRFQVSRWMPGAYDGQNAKAVQLKRGHSKQHRPDLKQLVYSLCVTRDGAVPVHFKAYDGNQTDDACNTAGAEGQGAEALSGIARSFFYAGARALLVSNWEVASDSAVTLIIRAFAALKAHPEIGRAEAMRISMRELIEKGRPTDAHPSMWAPFVVVGEGGTGR
jgi:hypothetical protein